MFIFFLFFPRLPTTLHKQSASMIIEMLQSDPQSRPSVDQLLKHEFFNAGYMPKQLPSSCLTMAPRFDQVEYSNTDRKPLHEINRGNNVMFLNFLLIIPATFFFQF